MNLNENPLIIQIYGKNNYTKVEYKIDDNIYKTRLIAEAWYNVFKKGDMVFLIPESIFINEAKNINEYIDILNDENKFKEHYMRKIEDQLENKDLIKNITILKLQSIGFYLPSAENNLSNLKIKFENNLDNIEVDLFKKLILLFEKYNPIIVDVSTGLNFYITIIMDVTKNYLIFHKLRNYISENFIEKNIILSTSPPVYISTTQIEKTHIKESPSYNIPNIQFKKPLVEFQEDTSMIRELNKEIQNKFERNTTKILRIIMDTKMGFNALKYNVPLFFYDDLVKLHFEYNNSLEILEKEIFPILNFINNFNNISINDNEIELTRAKINKDTFFGIIFFLGIYDTIKFITERCTEAEADEILNKFSNIYKKLDFNLNARFLETEINKIKRKMEHEKEKEWKLLLDVLASYNTYSNKKKEIEDSDIKRNFFAHCGLEYTMVNVMKSEKKLYLSYVKKDDVKNKILKWLRSPE